MKITKIFDRYGNEIDQLEGNPQVSGKNYVEHLPIRVVYYNIEEMLTVNIKQEE